MADAVTAASDKILAANSADMEAARGKITEVMLDRLLLTPRQNRGNGKRNTQGYRAARPDRAGAGNNHAPRRTYNKQNIGADGRYRDNLREPPQRHPDAAALAIKSGSACILRCGKEAHASAKAITLALQDGLERAGLSRDLVMLIDDIARQRKRAMCGKGIYRPAHTAGRFGTYPRVRGKRHCSVYRNGHGHLSYIRR